MEVIMYGALQRWILRACWQDKSARISRRVFLAYYDGKPTIKKENREGIITRSLEHLIDKGFLVGYGVRTPQKWFIREVRLTASGRRFVKNMLDRRQQLPFKLKTKKLQANKLIS